jgi:hypothetical protein
MRTDSRVRSFLRYAAIAGNIVYVLWILHNGIDEGFAGSLVQVVSMIGLMLLLVLNAVLLWRRER